jgi:hypothetical protein
VDATPVANETPRKAYGHSKRQRVVVAGILTYTRSDLERVLAQGKALDVTVFGTCGFAGDVSPELVDRAIGIFHLRGKLNASDEVRAVLKRKERAAAGWAAQTSE